MSRLIQTQPRNPALGIAAAVSGHAMGTQQKITFASKIQSMDKTNKKDTSVLTPSQIAWVVKDLEKAKTFFQEMLGVTNFSPTVTTRLKEYDETYYGEPSNAENLVAMTYSGGTTLTLKTRSISTKGVRQ